MSGTTTGKGIGFFSRLLDNTTPGERYALAAEQIRLAEDVGFDAAWVAQHHFHGSEGGLPSPLVFLAHVAASTSTIRLGTGIITLPLEDPLRVAEDAAVLDLLSGGRLEVGVGSGGTPSSFLAFGLDASARHDVYNRHLQVLRDAWSGKTLGSAANQLYPAAPQLLDRLWQATFSADGGRRAGEAGDGLMLSRTQPRPPARPDATLAQLQDPIVDAYLDALPPGRTPRILASRTLFVAQDRRQALRLAGQGLRRQVKAFERQGHVFTGTTVEELMTAFDAHVGTPADVVESLGRDTVLERATDVSFQVHSIDPPHADILRSIELTAASVLPQLGWNHIPAAA
ncbi:putative FMN-dependent luciferase-like monooxygenase [Arthrobacter sp. 35W]|uniref:putative FMN-dependent luciferase-like monooxygenase n=1 Tax=Arthrobacter sp. 35W TaxID=1132441 RepID=UPI00040F5DDD|nr:putative FMN-dependent luciferase-like monooxygenase [Arthrobacter sp. 35W]